MGRAISAGTNISLILERMPRERNVLHGTSTGTFVSYRAYLSTEALDVRIGSETECLGLIRIAIYFDLATRLQ